MSLMLEFPTPQNPEAMSAGMGTNWFFPKIACLRMQLTAKVERPRGQMGKPRRTPTHQLRKPIPAHSVSRSPDRKPNTSDYQ
jgi:hypothetical protein